jgi:hypothetical protein
MDDGSKFVRGLASGLLADLREGACAKAACDPPSEEEFVGRPDDQEVLRIRIRRIQLGPDDSGLHEAIDRIAAPAADPDDSDVRPKAREDPFELGVFRAQPEGLGRRLGDPGLRAGSADDFPHNGIHGPFSARKPSGSQVISVPA